MGVRELYEMYKTHKPIPAAIARELSSVLSDCYEYSVFKVGTSKRKEEADKRIKGRAEEADAVATSAGGGRAADQDYSKMTWQEIYQSARSNPFKK